MSADADLAANAFAPVVAALGEAGFAAAMVEALSCSLVVDNVCLMC